MVPEVANNPESGSKNAILIVSVIAGMALKVVARSPKAKNSFEERHRIYYFFLNYKILFASQKYLSFHDEYKSRVISQNIKRQFIVLLS